MKLKLLILGLILVLSGFISFVSIAFANIYFEENLFLHYTLIIIGFILIFFAAILFYLFINADKNKKSSN